MDLRNFKTEGLLPHSVQVMRGHYIAMPDGQLDVLDFVCIHVHVALYVLPCDAVQVILQFS